MSRTNDLRQLVKMMLDVSDFKGKHGIKEVYYKIASDSTMFPHLIFTVKSINLGYLDRKDYLITIDIYTKGSEKLANDIADDVERMFNNANMPCENILTTFFINGRRDVLDEDKKIQHIEIDIQAQLYEKEGVNNG